MQTPINWPAVTDAGSNVGYLMGQLKSMALNVERGRHMGNVGIIPIDQGNYLSGSGKWRSEAKHE